MEIEEDTRETSEGDVKSQATEEETPIRDPALKTFTPENKDQDRSSDELAKSEADGESMSQMEETPNVSRIELPTTEAQEESCPAPEKHSPINTQEHPDNDAPLPFIDSLVNVPRLGQSPTNVSSPHHITTETEEETVSRDSSEVDKNKLNDLKRNELNEKEEIDNLLTEKNIEDIESSLPVTLSNNSLSDVTMSSISESAVSSIQESQTEDIDSSQINCEISKPESPEALRGKDSSVKTVPEDADEQTNVALASDGLVPVEYEEPDFVWDEYLDETGSTAAPPTSFSHVECSLQSGFEKGMKVEVANKEEEGSYWIASIVMPCGQLLRLRWDGIGDTSTADFWCDISSSDIHSLGWCKGNDKRIVPPEVVKSKIESADEYLKKILDGAKSVPSYLLDGTTGTSPIENIKEGMRLEVQECLNPHAVWISRIMENVGGRLLLRYEGTDHANNDFWLFYTSHRLHSIGWAKEQSLKYTRPLCIDSEGKAEDEWQSVIDVALAEALESPLPPDIFKDQVEILPHDFKEGQKVEALHPKLPSVFSPGTIVKVYDENYFLLEIDDCSSEAEKKVVQQCLHGGSQSVFPMHWCMYKGQRITPPRGWPKRDFDWQEYLSQTGAEAAPESSFNNLMVFDTEIVKGMKLEAVNPSQPGQICAATVTRTQDNLLWLHLDCSPKMAANHVVDSRSHQIFPVGWCESNNYPLKPPRITSYKRKPPPVSQTNMSTEAAANSTYSQLKHGSGSSWCPKIYFNHRCFSGPFLSKGRIAELPKCVGPGPVTLVMKEVLSMLINVAYKSSRVLRELQLEGQPNPSMHQQILKAKYKGKSYQALVEICKSSDQIDEFCRQVCIKLECCPNLFSPLFISSFCPENCHQLTKTKYTYYYGKTKKKRKIGRPPGGHSNLEHGPKKPGKRRKKKKLNLGIQKKHNSGESDENQFDNVEDMDICDGDSNSTGSLERREGEDPDFRPAVVEDWSQSRGGKRKYQRHLPPPSDIKTRGAKLPKYSFERKTHQKVLLTSPKMQSPLPKTTKHKSAFKPVKPEPMLLLDSNPLYWSVKKVIEFIKTTDCANLARIFKDHEIDGQALLLLTLPTVQEYMELKLGPAVKLCHHIERVKVAFFEQYAG